MVREGHGRGRCGEITYLLGGAALATGPRRRVVSGVIGSVLGGTGGFQSGDGLDEDGAAILGVLCHTRGLQAIQAYA